MRPTTFQVLCVQNNREHNQDESTTKTPPSKFARILVCSTPSPGPVKHQPETTITTSKSNA